MVKCGECGKVDVKKVLGDGLDICDPCFSRWLLEGYARVVELGLKPCADFEAEVSEPKRV